MGKTNQAGEEKLWTFEFILMIFLGTFMGASSQLINASLPEHVINLGATLTVAQTVTSLMSFSAMILRPVSGAASDLLNRKTLLLISTLVVAGCLLTYGLAPSLGVMIVARFIHGMAFSVQGVSHLAFSTSFIPKSRMGEGMGFVAMGNILSQIIGPSIGIWLNDNYGATVMFIAAAASAAFAAAIVFFVPYKEQREAADAKTRLAGIKLSNLFSKEVVFFALLIGTFSCGNAVISGYLKLIAKERGIGNIGLYFSISAGVTVFIRMVAGKLSDKKGLSFVVFPAIIIEAVAMCILGVANTLFMLFAVAALRAIGTGLASPSIQGAAVNKVGRERSGVALSTLYIGQDLFHVVGPIALARVYEMTQSYKNMLFIYAAFVLSIDVIYAIYIRAHKGQET